MKKFGRFSSYFEWVCNNYFHDAYDPDFLKNHFLTFCLKGVFSSLQNINRRSILASKFNKTFNSFE